MKLTTRTPFYVAVIVQAIILIYLLLPRGNNNSILDFSRAPFAWFFSHNGETIILLNTTHACNPLKPTIKHKPGEVFVVVLVMSKSLYEDTREAVRQTWASKKLSVVSYVVFVVGCTPSIHLDRDVDKEATKYHDILRVDSQENKDPYEQKQLWLAYRWTVKYQPKFVIKTHYHVYVDLPRFVQWLQKVPSSGKLYAGKVHSNVAVNRDPNTTFFVSEKTYSSAKFPDYCSGAFYAFSGNLLKDLLALEEKIPRFDVEDAYFGVLMRKLEVEPMGIDNKIHLEGRLGNDIQSWTNQLYIDVFVIGKNLSPGLIQYIHDRYRGLGRPRHDNKT